MKILIATDSFKESLSSKQVANAIMEGMSDRRDIEFIVSSLADGGEGTMELLTNCLNGHTVKTKSNDPLGRLINTQFGISGDSKTAIIDVATSSGIELLAENEKCVMCTSSYGTGQLINEALDLNVENIILGLGSSATADLGFGLLSALGVKFLDSFGNLVEPKGSTLKHIERIDIRELNPKIKTVNLKVACDVDNILTGAHGSCLTFAKQKGASKQEIEELETEFIRLSKIIKELTNIDLNIVKGSGAAGGIGGISHAILGGSLISGSDLIIEYNHITDKIINCDLVITGEGRFDKQSLHGKGPMTIINLAKQYEKKCIVVCGSVDRCIYESEKLSDVAIFPSIMTVDSLERTLSESYNSIKHVAKAISNLI